MNIQIDLTALDSSDMTIVRAWRNDYKIWKWCRQNDLISDIEQARWFDAQSKDRSVKMYKILLTIKEGEEQKTVHIGVCGFSNIDLINRNAEFNIYIAPAYMGKKLGRKALSCLLNHGFKNYGFQVIWGEVFDGNPALKIFEDHGFKRDGTRRGFYFRDGKFIDAHLISLNVEEWNQSQIA